MAQHGLDVPHGLAVGTGGGGLVGRGGAGGEQQLDVTAVRGVVDDPRRVVVPVMEVARHRRWRRTRSEEASVSSTAWRTSSCRNQMWEASPASRPRCSATARLSSLGPQSTSTAVRSTRSGTMEMARTTSASVRGELAEAADDRVLDAARQTARAGPRSAR